MNIFYVYIYLDPRRQGSFDYGEFHFDFEPFYIGKGKGNQWLNHIKWAENKTYKGYKLNKIRKIQSLGLQPGVIKYKENLTEQEAFDLEKKLIKVIGRSDLGPLTNLTDGGEGTSGLVSWRKGKTKETHPGIARQAEAIKGRTKENDLGVVRAAEKRRGRTKENDSSIARQAEKMKVIMKGRTKENDLGKARQAKIIGGILKGRTKETYDSIARQAEKLRGRTKENDPSKASMAEKLRGRKRGTKEDTPWIARVAEKTKIRMMGKTKENDPGRARAAEKMKVIMMGNQNGRKMR